MKRKFLRQDAHKKRKLKRVWRQPKGLHSKIRRKLKSRRVHPSLGFAKPKKNKFLYRGMKTILVSNTKDIEKIKDGFAAIISSKLGNKKRIEIVEKLVAANKKIINIKNPQEFLSIAKKTKKEETIKQGTTKQTQ